MSTSDSRSQQRCNSTIEGSSVHVPNLPAKEESGSRLGMELLCTALHHQLLNVSVTACVFKGAIPEREREPAIWWIRGRDFRLNSTFKKLGPKYT